MGLGGEPPSSCTGAKRIAYKEGRASANNQSWPVRPALGGVTSSSGHPRALAGLALWTTPHGSSCRWQAETGATVDS